MKSKGNGKTNGNGHDGYDEAMAAAMASLAEPDVSKAEDPPETESEPDADAAPEVGQGEGLEAMNKKWFVVDIAGKARVGTFKRSEIFRGCLVPQYYTFADFRNLHDHKRKTITVEGNKKEIGLGSYWLRHAKRRQYEDVRFEPEAGPSKAGSFLNLWQGLAVEAEPGDWSLFCAHLLDNVCGGNRDYFEYLLDCMAFAVQRPGQRSEVAIVLRGREGVGKGIVLRYFGAIFGPHYRHISQANHLVGNFNAHLQHCALLFADEAFFAGDRQHEGQLKYLITEPMLMIEPKGIDSYQVRNCLKIWMSSNNEWVVPAGADARRFFVLDVAPNKKQDHAYFAAISDEMEHGGTEAMLHDLLLRDLSQFNEKLAPQTDALADQKARSRRGVDRLIEQICTEGSLPASRSLSEPNITITSGEENGTGFYALARKIAPDLKHLSSIVIGKTLKTDWGCTPWKSGYDRGLKFIELDELRAKFDARHGKQDWPPIKCWGDTEETGAND